MATGRDRCNLADAGPAPIVYEFKNPIGSSGAWAYTAVRSRRIKNQTLAWVKCSAPGPLPKPSLKLAESLLQVSTDFGLQRAPRPSL